MLKVSLVSQSWNESGSLRCVAIELSVAARNQFVYEEDDADVGRDVAHVRG